MHSHEAKGLSKVTVSCHYGNSCINMESRGREGAFEMAKSPKKIVLLLCVGRHESTLWQFMPFSSSPPISRVVQELNVRETASLCTCTAPLMQNVSEFFHFILPWPSGLQIVVLSWISVSNVMLTTTCITCISFIHDLYGVSKRQVLFKNKNIQSWISIVGCQLPFYFSEQLKKKQTKKKTLWLL